MKLELNTAKRLCELLTAAEGIGDDSYEVYLKVAVESGVIIEDDYRIYVRRKGDEGGSGELVTIGSMTDESIRATVTEIYNDLQD